MLSDQEVGGEEEKSADHDEGSRADLVGGKSDEATEEEKKSRLLSG